MDKNEQNIKLLAHFKNVTLLYYTVNRFLLKTEAIFN